MKGGEGGSDGGRVEKSGGEGKVEGGMERDLREEGNGMDGNEENKGGRRREVRKEDVWPRGGQGGGISSMICTFV
jgi:hypothetical protein